MRRSSRPTADGRVPFISSQPDEAPSPSCSAPAAPTPTSPVLLPLAVTVGSSSCSVLPLHRAGPLHSHSRHSHNGVLTILQAGGGPIPPSGRMSSNGIPSPRSTLSHSPTLDCVPDDYDEPEAGSMSWWNSLTRADVSLLLSAYAVLFSRYLVSQQLAGFFTSVADNAGISSSWVGLIFMAYPLGMSITSVVAPSIVRRIGTRNALSLGLVATVVANIGFGLTPDICSQPLQDATPSRAADGGGLCLRLTFWSLYFLNGLVGATAETACIILLSSRFLPVLGTVMAHVNTASTCGCFVGSFLGGVLYDAGPDDFPATKFRLPFFATSLFVSLLLPLRCALPQEYLGADSTTAAPMRSVVSRSILLGLTAVMLSAAVLGTLDTNLPYRLQAPPFWLTMSELAAVTSLSSGAYLFLMFPIGWLVGKASPSSRRLKLATGSGFLILAASFAMLGPVGAWGGLNSTPFAVSAMLLRAAGSAVSCNFVYPDLVFGIPHDESSLHATISTLWNAAYAIGWAVGPYAGGLLYAAFSRTSLCTILQKGACDDMGSGAPPGCSCVWRPDNGFVGFSNVTVAVCGAVAAVNFVAAALNVHDELPPPPKLTLPEEPDQGLHPAVTVRAAERQHGPSAASHLAN